MSGADDNLVVKAENLSKYYRKGSDSVEVLRDLSLGVGRGEFVAVMGPSGSGKTTLLNLIGGLDKPSAGQLTVMGERLETLSDGKLSRWRSRQLGFVFQAFNLLPKLTAERNVELPLLLNSMSRSERKRHVSTAISLVNLDHRARHYPGQLSGGEEQRVAIARAIVHDPAILLCDEPTGELDRKTGDDILNLLQVLNKEHGKTLIVVTHNPRAAAVADRTLHLEDGRLAQGPAA